MSQRIILLGSKGMLGQMVNSFFNKNAYEITCFDKRFDENSIVEYINELNNFENSIVINCVGKIKQKTNVAYDLFLSNSILPLELSRSLKSGHLLIHPSTDCVFDGNTAKPYLVADKHTADDIYGISKSMGELAISHRPNSLILRVSIIGPDAKSSKGLLSWFLNNPVHSHLQGYTNHFWNGITTLEWCEKLLFFLNDKKVLDGLLERKIIQLGMKEIYSKYDILVLFNKIFNKKISITPYNAERTINRCLEAEIISMSLEEQLNKLNIYMKENL